MAFDNWYKNNERRIWLTMPWIKDDLKAAYEAGRKDAKPKKKKVQPKKG